MDALTQSGINVFLMASVPVLSAVRRSSSLQFCGHPDDDFPSPSQRKRLVGRSVGSAFGTLNPALADLSAVENALLPPQFLFGNKRLDIAL